MKIKQNFNKIIQKIIANKQIKQNTKKKNQLLQEFLYYVRTYSPWYQKQLKNVSINLVTEKNLIDLPHLSKKILMENWDEIVTDRSLSLSRVKSHLAKMMNSKELEILDDKYLVLSTGGSSGMKGIFLVNYNEAKNQLINRSHIDKTEYAKFVDFNSGEKLRISQVIVENGVYIMYAMSKIVTPEYVEKFYHPINLPMSEIIDGLNSIQPHILVTIPSIIYLLAHERLKGNLKINPKYINVGAEPLYQEIRHLIYKAWPLSLLYNFYGASEGFVATSCRPNTDKMHLPNDLYTFIPVNQFNQRINNEEYSHKLLFTNLYSYTLPLINYEIEDQIYFLNENCNCGQTTPLITDPLARNTHYFIYNKNIIVHPLIFTTPLLLDGNIIEFQVQQTSAGANILIVSEGKVRECEIIENIKQAYSRLGLPKADIKIQYANKIERQHESGKLKRFIPLVIESTK